MPNFSGLNIVTNAEIETLKANIAVQTAKKSIVKMNLKILPFAFIKLSNLS